VTGWPQYLPSKSLIIHYSPIVLSFSYVATDTRRTFVK
jgi:hypothetical protein